MKRGLMYALVLLFLSTKFCFGQATGLSLQPGFQFGQAIVPEGQDKKPFQQYGFTFDLNRQTNGKSYWQADHKYPQMGLQFAGRFFEKTQGSKSAFTLIPYLEFNVWKSAFGTLQIKHGTGLAYASGDWKSGDRTLLGSRLNAATLLDLGYQFGSKSQLEIKAGALLSHISNGNLVQPNAGLNSVLAYVQLMYFPAKKLSERLPFEKQTPSRRWGLRVGTAAGFYDYRKETNSMGRNLQVSLLAVYQHSTRFRSSGGVEVGRLGRGNSIQPAIYVEEEVLIGHLTTRYGLGAYLTSPLADEGRTYGKVGIAWYPGRLENHTPRGFSIGANIKAHGFRAAHVEIVTALTL